MRRFRTVAIGVAVALAAGAAGYWAAVRMHSTAPTRGVIDFVLPDLDGTPRRLSQWRGQPMVLNFWATWCLPCREEIPLLVDAQRRYAARGLQVIGVAIDERRAAAGYSAQHGINYPVLLADDHTFELLTQYGNRAGALPYTVVFSADGDVLQRKLGAFRQVDLERAIENALSASNR